MLVIWSEHMRYLSRWNLSYVQNFMQDMTSLSFQRPTLSAFLCTSIWQSANSRSWTFVTLLSVVTILGPLAWCINNRRANMLKLDYKFLTMVIEGEVSLNTASQHSLISLRDFLPKARLESSTDIALFPSFYIRWTCPLPYVVKRNLWVQFGWNFESSGIQECTTRK